MEECYKTKGCAGMGEHAECETCRCLLVSVVAFVGVCSCWYCSYQYLLAGVLAGVSVYNVDRRPP